MWGKTSSQGRSTTPPNPSQGTGPPPTHTMDGTNPPQNLPMPYLESLNIHDLTKLTNYPTWPNISTKIPSNIPKFEGRTGEDLANHVMTFHLWLSSNRIMDDSICLNLFQHTLTGSSAKWYVDEILGSHATFESLAKAFLSFFQLLVLSFFQLLALHDTGLELLSDFKQTITIHIAD
jgi:hypothetical protein